MSKWLIIHTKDIDDELIKLLKLDVNNLSYIQIEGATEELEYDSPWFIASYDFSKNYPQRLKEFKRFSQKEVSAEAFKIRKGLSVENKHIYIGRTSAFLDSEGHRQRTKGGYKFTALAGQTAYQDSILTEDRILKGGWFRCKDFNDDDQVDFEVVHPLYGPIDKFVDGWYVLREYESILSDYFAKLPAGLILRLTYHNNGANDVKVRCNLDLHKT